MSVECREMQDIRWEVIEQTLIESAIEQIKKLDCYSYHSPRLDQAIRLLTEESEVLEEKIQSHFE